MSLASLLRRNPPQKDRGNWPLERKLALDWIIGELVWMRHDRHPHLAKIVSASYPCGTDTEKLGLRMHEWMYRHILSSSPTWAMEGQQELYRLLEDTAHEFNRVVLSNSGAHPVSPDSQWPFLYWSYIRQNTGQISRADKKYSDPYGFKTGFLSENLPVRGADTIFFDRIRRFHRRPITIGEVPKDELEPPSIT